MKTDESQIVTASIAFAICFYNNDESQWRNIRIAAKLGAEAIVSDINPEELFQTFGKNGRLRLYEECCPDDDALGVCVDVTHNYKSGFVEWHFVDPSGEELMPGIELVANDINIFENKTLFLNGDRSLRFAYHEYRAAILDIAKILAQEYDKRRVSTAEDPSLESPIFFMLNPEVADQNYKYREALRKTRG